MSREIIVDLVDTYLDGELKRVVLREPVCGDIMKHGEPWEMVRVGGAIHPVENSMAINAYFRALLVEPKSFVYLEKLSAADTMRVKEALLSFFAREKERSFAGTPLFSSELGGAA